MNIEIKTVPTEKIFLDDQLFDITAIEGVINALDRCGGLLKTVQISDKDLKAKLSKENIIRFNSRGGAFPGPEFKKFKTRIKNILTNE